MEDRRPVTLARAIRGAFFAYVDEIVLFLSVNVVLVLATMAVVTAAAIVPLLAVLAPLLALPAAVLMRLAIAAARDDAPSWRLARGEVRRLAGRKVGLAAAQLLVMAFALLNLSLAPSMGGFIGVAVTIVAGYALIAVSVYAVALWSIVCDPAREGPLRDQLRLALAVVLLRPIQLVVLATITVLSVLVSIQLVVPASFLPSLVMLVIAAYVIDVADRLRLADA